jgi:8-oxo-dGTP pyrophosphatase MutT (NUDIX family)
VTTPGRIDHLDNPDAPAPNSIVPAVNVIVTNEAGDILLIRRTDNGRYALPGGGMDLGESITDAAVRETSEETGLVVDVVGLVGIYTNPGHLIEYTSDGEVRQEFAVVLSARPRAGELATSPESSEVLWVPPVDLAHLDLHPTQRQRIAHFLEHRTAPHLD